MRTKQNGLSLIGTMVALVILLGATAFYFTGGLGLMEEPSERPDGKGETIVGRSMYAAKDSNCRTQLQQLRMSVVIHTDPVNDIFPTRIQDLEMGLSYYLCPVGEENYGYNPSTGEVSCPHLGHEDY